VRTIVDQPAIECEVVMSLDVLNGVNLTLNAGEVHAPLGPNGADKSTTIAAASGQSFPSIGELVALQRLRDRRNARRARMRRRVPDRAARHLPEPQRDRQAAHDDIHRNALHEVQERVFSQFPRCRSHDVISAYFGGTHH
jgi:ABC-type branched-subunit amino acid transport system ATPase component